MPPKGPGYSIGCQFCHIRDATMTRNGKRESNEGTVRFGNTYADETCVKALGLTEFFEPIRDIDADEPKPRENASETKPGGVPHA